MMISRSAFHYLAASLFVFCVTAVANAQTDSDKPVVAVFDISTEGITLPRKTLIRTTGYLSSRITAEGLFRAAPPSTIKEALIGLKLESQKDCYDIGCRIELGRASAANKNLNSLFWKVGKKCVFTADVYDLRTEAMDNSVEIGGLECSEAGLKLGIFEAAAKLSGKDTNPNENKERTDGIVNARKSQPKTIDTDMKDSNPTPSTKSETGFISVEGSPVGSRVTIAGPSSFGKNGRMVLSLPVRPLEVPAGTYDVTVVADDFDQFNSEIRVFADATAVVTVALVQSTGELKISGTPEGAKTVVTCSNGFKREFGLPRKTWTARIPHGECLLTVIRDSYETYSEDFTMEGGGVISRTIELRRTASTEIGVNAMGSWVRVSTGTYLMGSPPADNERFDDEGPQTLVKISRPFFIKTTEVTQGEWKAIFGNNPSAFDACGDSCPVENITWWEAAAFCNEMSRRERLELCYDLQGCSGKPGQGMKCRSARNRGAACKGFRLPTEAEWEFAARADSLDSRYAAPDSSSWHRSNAGNKTHSTALKNPNQLGLYDVLGNVWEWCDDWKGRYKGGNAVDPKGPVSGKDKVVRGGAWDSELGYIRLPRRHRASPDHRAGSIGFRPVRSTR